MRKLALAGLSACAWSLGLTAAPSDAREQAAAARAADEPGLVGMWRIVRCEDVSADGTVAYPFGERPLGYFVYDATGHLSVQVMRNPPVRPFASGADDKPTDAEARAAYLGYAAYFGTYRVDKTNHVLHHVVEGALEPGYVGTDQPRPYRLNGDTLIIEVNDPATGARAYRELRRLGR